MLEVDNLRETLLNLGRGFEISQCVFVAAQLHLADLLAEGPQHCDTLAKATATQSDALYRLLRVLASVGIVTEMAPRQFQLTALGGYLRRDTPGSVHDFLIMRAEQSYTIWGQLLYSLQQGKSAFEQAFGMSRYQYFEQNPAAGARFDKAMTELSKHHSVAAATAYDFSTIATLVDVGGGEGHLLMTLLQQYPHLHGILFEQQKATLEKGKVAMAKAGVANRCEFVEGDFFTKIPAGAEAYLLKHVLHNWDDTRALQILQNCFQAIRQQGRLLIIEEVLKPDAPLKPKLLDLRLLVELSGGRMRTESEFQRLLEAASFRLIKINPTKLDFSILEARPATLLN